MGLGGEGWDTDKAPVVTFRPSTPAGNPYGPVRWTYESDVDGKEWSVAGESKSNVFEQLMGKLWR